MTLGAPGPRDWTPSEPSTFAPPRSQRTGSPRIYDSWASARNPPPRQKPIRGDGRFTGWLALLLGIGALAIAVVQPSSNGSAVQSGFITSSVGVFAIVLGIRAIRQQRFGRRSGVVAARLGVLFGGIGTAIMAYALIAFLLLSAGVQLPALPTLAAPGVSPQGLVLGSQPADSNNAGPELPVVPPPVTSYGSADEERIALAGVLGSAAYALNLNQNPDAAWPASIAFAPDSTTIVTDAGLVLAIAPSGTQMLYTRSSDGWSYSLTLFGSQYATVTSYESVSGLIS